MSKHESIRPVSVPAPCRGNLPAFQHADTPITVLSERLQAGYTSAPHSHARGQLIYASKGIIVASIEGKSWIVSPTRAAWVMPHQLHAIECVTVTDISTLYVDSTQAKGLPGRSCLMSISPLFKEMALRLARFSGASEHDPARARLIPSMIDELQALPLEALQLTMPTDRRLRHMCERLRREPACNATVVTLAKEAALSSRHLMRLFQDETGMQFGAWRQQMRLMAALPYLADGMPVMQVSQRVGYHSVAAFSTAFKRTFGTPPSQYFNA